ncbi:MAG TPA: ABC transporter permease, partial [Conexibacter sp.]
DVATRAQRAWRRTLLRRPEIGAIAAALVVFVLFAVEAGDKGFLSKIGIAGFLEVSAELGIIAAGVTLLMIAGEFDVSVGSMLGAAGLMIAIPVAEYGWPLWAALLFACSGAVLVGVVNGMLVVKTKLPSFIVTLALLFALRGLALAVTRLVTDKTQIEGLREALDGDPLFQLFGGQIAGFPVSIVWWIGLTIVGTYVLTQTRFGNWVFGAGGDEVAARNVGVPVNRVKVTLFIVTALCATLVAALSTLSAGSADVLRGESKEFQAITAAVIGGSLLTGGYGSILGTFFGALIFGMVSQGFYYTGVDPDWFQVFLGGMLLVAVLFNTYIRKRALNAR